MHAFHRLSPAFFAFGFLAIAAPLAAQSVPGTLNYQGRLTDNSPLQSPVNAVVPMRFDLFDAAAGGVSLWNETDPVVVTQGLFSVQLGAGANPIPTAVFTGGSQRWLQVTLNPGTGSAENLAPRQQLAANAYAAQAQNSAQAANSAQLAGVADSGWQKALIGGCPAGQYVSYLSQGGIPVCSAPATNVPVPLNVSGNTPLAAVIAANNDGAGRAIIGVSVNGDGIYGASNAGVSGVTGVRGESYASGGYGVVGRNLATTGPGIGVYGLVSGGGDGVHGDGGQSGIGVTGSSANGIGVRGISSGYYGVYGFSQTSTAVAGFSATGFAGEFFGPVRVSGDVTSGGRFAIGVYTQVCAPNAAIYDCYCNGGDIAIGGGAYNAVGGGTLRESRPFTANSWRVACANNNADVLCPQAFAVCLSHGN